MRQTYRLLACVAMASFLGGCALSPPKWQPVKTGSYAVSKQGYSVDLPTGWLELPARDSSGVIVSYNGPDLDNIIIAHSKNDEIFKPIKKEASPDELPADLAADYIALAKTEGNPGLQVISNEPADLGGKSGFHMVFEFSTRAGLSYRTETYAVCTPDGFYSVVYRAPVLHYYDLYHPAYKAVVDSFKLTSGTH